MAATGLLDCVQTIAQYCSQPGLRSANNYISEAIHKNQVGRLWLSLRRTCCVEQSPRWASPYYWHWSIQMLSSQNCTFFENISLLVLLDSFVNHQRLVQGQLYSILEGKIVQR